MSARPLSTVSVRPLSTADLPAVLALEETLFPDDPWPARTFVEELDPSRRDRYYLAATDGEGLVGYAGLLLSEVADVLTIAVDPARHGCGIGSTLLSALLTEAARRGCTEVFLEVRADNPRAWRLYRRFGFAQVGVRRGYYQPSGADAIVMRRTGGR